MKTLHEAAPDHATPSGGQEAGPQEDRIEAAYWRFDARHKGYSQWKTAPMSERDAFKAEMRNALEAEKVRAEMRLVARGWRRPDAPAAPASQWMPIETAPKDGTPVLLLTNERWKDCRPGTQFVGINRGNLSEWCFYAPVGMGGIPDAWLDGWMPLPAAPDDLRDVAEKVAPAAPVPDGMVPNAGEVICPNCAHQFRAIPENVQSLLLASGHEPPFTASPAAPVVPLTDEQIRTMWKSSEFRGNGGQVDWFCEGIRAAEAHHGITGASK